MELALLTGKKLVSMFVLMIIGIAASKTKIIKTESKSQLSDILLLLINPMVVIQSYQKEFDASLAQNLFYSFILGALSFLLIILFTNLFVSKKHEEYTIERINVIYSNCGFIGIPIVNAILGTTGVFYLTAYMTVFNILLWTHGVILMTGKAKMKETIRNICTPTIFATIFGIISFMTGMLLPEIIAEPIGTIGNMNTPFAMIVAGATLAETDIKSCLKDFRVYYLTVLKLIVIPLVVCLAFVWIPLDGVVKLVPLIATACPAGASGTMFALRYKRNSAYASQLFAITTILSMTTLPVMVFLMMRFLHVS